MAASLAYVGLGANLGDARAALDSAFEALAALPGTELLRRSSLWRSAPIDSGGPDYLNAVAELRSTLAPLELLHRLQAIELAHGRERPYRNAPRTLDLDLLTMDGINLATPELTLPHPRAHERAFVLAPLLEVWPDAIIPGRGAASQCRERLAGQAIERLVLESP